MGKMKEIFTQMREDEAAQERLNKREEAYWNSQPAPKKPTAHKGTNPPKGTTPKEDASN